MRDHRPTDTEALIASSSLANLQSQVKAILAIDAVLQQLLPSQMAAHCRAANLRDGRLVVEVASAALRMKLEYERLSLLSRLRQHGFANLVSLELKINPSLYRNLSPAPADTPKREPLSDAAASAILSIAHMAPDKIRQRLERIAALASQSDSHK